MISAVTGQICGGMHAVLDGRILAIPPQLPQMLAKLTGTLLIAAPAASVIIPGSVHLRLSSAMKCQICSMCMLLIEKHLTWPRISINCWLKWLD